MEDILSWNKLSALGLVYKINKEILHPLGYSLCYDADTGASQGVMVSDDGVWDYGEESIAKGEAKLKANFGN